MMALLNVQFFAWTLLLLVAWIVFIQTTSVALFVKTLFKFSRPNVPDESLPPAAVVLSIRGPDPFLDETLESLLNQDYPRFLISVVLDDIDDPARKIVESVVKRSGSDKVRISVLNDKRATCSLKCSSLIHAVEELEPEYQVVAFIDGDAKPSIHWLRDLVVPLRDPSIGVVTGNRWYMPEVANWGSLVRYFWNAGAVVQMWFNGIVWAGSMAMRRATIRKIGLLPAWSRALSVDNTVYRKVKEHGLRVHFAPGVILVNAEYIRLSSFSGWVRRQLVGAKSSSDSWAVLMLHAIILALSQVLGGILLLLAILYGNSTALMVTLTALGLYWTANVGAAVALEIAARRIARLNGQPRQWVGTAALLKMYPAMFLTHFIYLVDLLAASFTRRVSWRGIDYAVLGKNNVRLISYFPYSETARAKSISSVI